MIVYLQGTVDTISIQDLAKKKIVSAVFKDGDVIVARYGVNKTTLKKILKKGA
jgi:hypothetical protein